VPRSSRASGPRFAPRSSASSPRCWKRRTATLLVLNQTREKIGVLYGDAETTGGGGNALPFYASCRLRTSPAKKIEHEKLDKAIGVNIKIKNVKNRSCAPFCESEGIQLLFETASTRSAAC
jgi:RecA/RadA recombinase